MQILLNILLLSTIIYGQLFVDSIHIIDSSVYGSVVSEGSYVDYVHSGTFPLYDTLLDSFSVIVTVDGIESDTVYEYIKIIPDFRLSISVYPNPVYSVHTTLSVRSSISVDDMISQYKIFDAVGNSITDWTSMTFNGSDHSVGIWDLRNKNGRRVASGSYLVVYRISIDRNGSVFRKEHRAMINVYER